MNTTTIYKEEIGNSVVWDTITRDLGLPADTDEIIVKEVFHLTETKRQESRKKDEEQPAPNTDNANPNTIKIVIAGGAVQSVIKPAGMALEIKDYDIGGALPDDGKIYMQDKEGDWYQRMFWYENETEEL